MRRVRLCPWVHEPRALPHVDFYFSTEKGETKGKGGDRCPFVSNYVTHTAARTWMGGWRRGKLNDFQPKCISLKMGWDFIVLLLVHILLKGIKKNGEKRRKEWVEERHSKRKSRKEKENSDWKFEKIYKSFFLSLSLFRSLHNLWFQSDTKEPQ